MAYKVRLNGDIVLETDDKDDAVARYMNLIALHPSCECAVIDGVDENGDECLMDAYSGPADPSDEELLTANLKGNDQFWEALRTMGEAYWAYMECEADKDKAGMEEAQQKQELAVAEVLVASGMWDIVQKEHE